MVNIPVEWLVGIASLAVGTIGLLFRLLIKAKDDLLLERQARLTFAETKLVETEKREAANAEREKTNATMLADLLDLTRAQTGRALPARRPGSLPGVR